MLKNSETVNLTCRLDKSVYEVLARDAESKGISINSLINGMTKNYISWEKYAEKIGFIPLSKKAVSRIFDNLESDTIKKIAIEVGATIPKEMLYMTSKDSSFESISKIIPIWSKRFGIENITHEDSKITLTIHHGVSEKFSEYITELFKAMADSLSFRLQVEVIDTNFVRMSMQK